MHIWLPEEAQQILDDVCRANSTNEDLQTSKSDWVVVFSTADTDVQASRLNTVLKDFDRLQIDQ